MTYHFHCNGLKFPRTGFPSGVGLFIQHIFDLYDRTTPQSAPQTAPQARGALNIPACTGFLNSPVHIPHIYSRCYCSATFPIVPIIPRFPTSPIQKSIDHIVSFQLYVLHPYSPDSKVSENDSFPHAGTCGAFPVVQICTGKFK